MCQKARRARGRGSGAKQDKDAPGGGNTTTLELEVSAAAIVTEGGRRNVDEAAIVERRLRAAKLKLREARQPWANTPQVRAPG